MRYLVILISIFLIGLALPVYSGGKQEDRLDAAEQLIYEKRYNDAIKIITDVIKTNPKLLDHGEKLLKKIRDARSNYNQVFKDLAVMLQQDEIDEEAAYALVQELKELDKNPNEASVKAVAEATAGIVFKVNDRQFRRIMDEANGMLAEGMYWAAVEHYLTGFSLHREQFETDGYGELVESRVDSLIDDIREQAAVFLDQETFLTTEVDNNLEVALAADPATFYQQVQTVSDMLIALMETRKEVENLADTLEEQRQVLVTGQETEDIPFLSTLRILAKGRETDGEFNGVAGAIDAFWDHGVAAMETASGNSLQSNLDAGILAVSQERWEDALLFFNNAYIYSLAAVYGGSLRLTREQAAGADPGAETSLAAQAAVIPPVIDAQVSGKIARGYEKLIPYYQGVDQLIQNSQDVEDFDQLQVVRADIVSRFDDIKGLIKEWDTYSDYYLILADDGLVLEDSSRKIRNFMGVLEGYENDMMTKEGQIVHRINEVYFEPLVLQFGEQAALLEEGKLLLAGTSEGEGENTVTKKYPREAIELLQPVTQLLLNIDDGASQRLTELKNENEYVTENEIIIQDILEGEEFVSRLRSFQEEVKGILSEADREVQLARLFRSNGSEKIDEAERRLSTNEFKEALTALDEAGVAFAESLKHQEDERFREEIDRQKQNLVESITKDWQNLVVRQVRSYINEANTLYQREEFAKAQVALLKAEDVWSDANAEQNEEIDSWLIRVENALRATTGRVIQKTNPVYAEMSNLLNLAQDDFQQGKQKLNQGDIEKAEEYFTRAEEKISYVKDPFPINQAAGVLLLRIEQLRDPVNFNDLFSNRFDEAVKMLGTEDEAIGYSLLKDLQAINPKYPGIVNAIYNFEISLGIRERPPDQRKIAAANRLYEEAQVILSKSRLSDIDFEVALDKLNEAYRNNPNDTKITSLKDRAQLLRGGSATILDTQDQQQFRLAEQLFLDRKYFEALAVVERLLADPKNQRYAPLNDLKRRIDSFI